VPALTAGLIWERWDDHCRQLQWEARRLLVQWFPAEASSYAWGRCHWASASGPAPAWLPPAACLLLPMALQGGHWQGALPAAARWLLGLPRQARAPAGAPAAAAPCACTCAAPGWGRARAAAGGAAPRTSRPTSPAPQAATAAAAVARAAAAEVGAPEAQGLLVPAAWLPGVPWPRSTVPLPAALEQSSQLHPEWPAPPPHLIQLQPPRRCLPGPGRTLPWVSPAAQAVLRVWPGVARLQLSADRLAQRLLRPQQTPLLLP
jgi:hypothetical protein